MDDNPIQIRQRLRTAVQQKLVGLHQAGVQQLGKIPPRGAFAPLEELEVVPSATAANPSEGDDLAKPSPAGRDPSGVAPVQPSSPPAISVPAASPLPTLATLESEVAACTLCADLVRSRTQTVFGVGDPHARLCFFGEAPGADEDRVGEPFVGKAGQLLDRIIAACTLRREQVYILNVLKCHPPGDRNPAADEVANCRFFFERQLEIIAPEFICCLGAVAAQSLLQTTQSVGKLRGRFHDYRNSKVIVTYHPAYLLRSPDQKRKTWDDMKMLMNEMGIELPKR